MVAPICMAETIRYAIKNYRTARKGRYGKLIQILPWIVSTRSTGSPADWKVKNRISMTNNAVSILIIRLSEPKEDIRS